MDVGGTRGGEGAGGQGGGARARAGADAGPRTRRSPRWRAGSRRSRRAILEANRPDLERARAAGHPRAFLDRLTLTESRIEEMAAGLRHVAGLPDPVGETVETWRRPNGLEIARVRVPLGVIGFIYESRPNVTADAAGLCLKSGNAVLLRGGSEALESNTMIAHILARAVEKAGPARRGHPGVDTPDRAAVLAMLTLDRYLDLIIPRGGEEFVRLVAERSTVPVLKHDKGLCHVYVDEGADLDMAVAVAVNAKAQRVERLQRAGDAARARGRRRALPARGWPRGSRRRAWRSRGRRAGPGPDARRPGRPSRRTGTRSISTYILAVRVVESFDEAVAHIRRHGSGLAEAIVTRDLRRARRFTQRGRRGGGARQRLDAARGRQPVRDGRGDGHLHLPRPRPGPGRACAS